MNRAEFLQKMVLDEVADDYENVDQIILPFVARECAKLGLTVHRWDIVDALALLVENGLVKAYRLSSSAPTTQPLVGMPSLEVIEEYFETYFYITKPGREVDLADDSWWPFDDEGQPIPNWQLPTET